MTFLKSLAHHRFSNYPSSFHLFSKIAAGAQRAVATSALIIVCLGAQSLRAQSSTAHPNGIFGISKQFQASGSDLVVKDFRFSSGEKLPELKLHYLTIGAPIRDSAGNITNAILMLHGTGSSGSQFLDPRIADVLFGRGQPFDVTKFFVILPDAIGGGGSSKPSNGLRTKFPAYNYDDMVKAQRLVVSHLGIKHLYTIIGTSMGCMHTFVWAESYPTEMDSVVSLGCLPSPVVGRNRMWRAMAINAIRDDPEWNQGNYSKEPTNGLRTAAALMAFILGGARELESRLPTAGAADKYAREIVDQIASMFDANDLIYQLDASSGYDPAPALDRIVARVLWINSADDVVSPPELGIADSLAAKIKSAKYVLLPVGPASHGHLTEMWAASWVGYLTDFFRYAPVG